MRSSTIFPDIAELDRANGAVSIRQIFRTVTLAPRGWVWLADPPAEPDPLAVEVAPRRPLAGPGRAAVVEVGHG